MKKILRMGLIATLIVSTLFIGVFAIDFDKTVIFYSETGGGEITFSENTATNNITWVNDQIRFANLTFGGYNWGDIGFSAPNTSATMNIDSINASHIEITTAQPSNSTYEVWLPAEYEPNISGATASYWVSSVLTYSMTGNGTVIIDWIATPPNPPEPTPNTYALIDSYPEVNRDSTAGLKTVHPSVISQQSAWGQTFTATGTLNLTSVKFYLKKLGAPTGNLTAHLYALAASKPNGAPLATSGIVSSSILTASAELISFNFTGDERYTLISGTTYGLGVTADTAFVSTVSYPGVEMDGSAPGHSGNSFFYQDGLWNTYTSDLIFYVYGAGYEPEITSITSLPFTINNANWVNISIQDINGYGNFDTVTLQVNTTGDANTVIMLWDQTSDTFTETSDPDGINIFYNTSCVSTNVGLNVTNLSFYFNLTAGQGGFATSHVTVTDDEGLTDTDSQLFSFTYYDWAGNVYDWINSAFGMFGVGDFMQKITTYITGVTAFFTESLIYMVDLIQLQFSLILNVFPWFLRWSTRFIARIIDMGSIVVSILNGTHDIMTGLGSIWATIEIGSWVDIIVLLGIFTWIESIARRGRTYGELSVFIGDIQTAMNMFGYFMSMFANVINIVIDNVFRLFEAIN